MDQQIEFVTEFSDKGQRIDKCVAMKLGEGYSRTFVKDLIESGNIKVDGLSVKPRHIVKEMERIAVNIPSREQHTLDPENIRLSIMYEDEHLIVIDKPAGMVVHPGAGNARGTLVSALLYHLGNLPQGADAAERPGIVHRLDKDTSGVMVVAKTDKAMRSLAKQFQNRTVKKTYVAVVTGNVEMDNGMVDAPLARQKLDRKKMGVEYSSGRPAKTVYHVVERYGRFTILKLDLFTGRTHQIRVHMKYIGHPIAGDAAYGGKGDIARQALHAQFLGFTHPGTLKGVEFLSPIPKDMSDFIKAIKRSSAERKKN